jgi:lipoate-protein ligase A
MNVIFDGRAKASFHMQKDKELIEDGGDSTLLRFYEWDSFCITTGIFIEPEEFVDLKKCSERGVEIAKRPTGGGLLFHGFDLPFTLFFPASHPLCALSVERACEKINKTILKALSPWLLPEKSKHEASRGKRCELCMAQKTPFDLLWSGYKIGGCAQRKTKRGLLHQVSLFFETPDWDILSTLLCKREDFYAMQEVTRSCTDCMRGSPSKKEIQISIREECIGRFK